MPAGRLPTHASEATIKANILTTTATLIRRTLSLARTKARGAPFLVTARSLLVTRVVSVLKCSRYIETALSEVYATRSSTRLYLAAIFAT